MEKFKFEIKDAFKKQLKECGDLPHYIIACEGLNHTLNILKQIQSGYIWTRIDSVYGDVCLYKENERIRKPFETIGDAIFELNALGYECMIFKSVKEFVIYLNEYYKPN